MSNARYSACEVSTIMLQRVARHVDKDSRPCRRSRARAAWPSMDLAHSVEKVWVVAQSLRASNAKRHSSADHVRRVIGRDPLRTLAAILASPPQKPRSRSQPIAHAIVPTAPIAPTPMPNPTPSPRVSSVVEQPCNPPIPASMVVKRSRRTFAPDRRTLHTRPIMFWLPFWFHGWFEN